MIFPQYVIYVLIYDYLKFRKDPSITSKEIANYISVALAVALSVCSENQVALPRSWCTSLFSHMQKAGFLTTRLILQLHRLRITNLGADRPAWINS